MGRAHDHRRAEEHRIDMGSVQVRVHRYVGIARQPPPAGDDARALHLPHRCAHMGELVSPAGRWSGASLGFCWAHSPAYTMAACLYKTASLNHW